MYLKITRKLVKQALPDGEIIPVVEGRPNLSRIDLARVSFLKVPSPGSSTIKWATLVAFMKRQLRKGFLTLGAREFMAIFCDNGVNGWLEQQPRNSPWKFGNGGLIGFPDGLIRMKGRALCYDVALWIPSAGWHLRVFEAETPSAYPDWFDFLRLPVYPLG